MPGYKKYSKRPPRRYRRYRKRTYKRRPNLYKAINNVLNKRMETKYNDVSISSTALTSAYTYVQLNDQFVQGTDFDEIVGDSYNIKQVQIRGEIYNADATNNGTIRMMLVAWYDVNDTFNPQRILKYYTASEIVHSPYNMHEGRTFRILTDKKRMLSANDVDNYNRTWHFDIIYNFRKGFKTTKNESSQVTPILALLICCDKSTSFPVYKLNYRVKYTDA